jgi:hypothetical protein
MTFPSPHPGAPVIAVFGATGMVGRRVCDALADAGATIRRVARSAASLAATDRGLPGATSQVADAGDPAALARAFAGVRVVVNAAGPLRDIAAGVLEAAIAARAHYVDVGAEQAVVRALYELHESAVRRAGLVALPGAGLDAMIGDLAAAWAATHLGGNDSDPGDAVRAEPAARFAEDRPLDEIAVSYVFDDLALTAGSQRTLFGAVGSRALVWQRDRWEAGRAGEHRRINAGPALGGERDAQAYAGAAVITLPRHVAAQRVVSFVSITRRPAAAAALRAISRALPWLPRRAGDALAPYVPSDADYGATQLAVVAQVRRGFSAAQIVVRGHDLYRTAAVVAAWSACRLAERSTGPTGMCAPGELLRAEPALRAIARAADLTIEPSFG